MSNAAGRPAEPIREAWAMRFGLDSHRMRMQLTDALLWQLTRYRNDEARRLILGISILQDLDIEILADCVRGAVIVKCKREQMRRDRA